jgi:hypothetical protein
MSELLLCCIPLAQLVTGEKWVYDTKVPFSLTRWLFALALSARCTVAWNEMGGWMDG